MSNEQKLTLNKRALEELVFQLETDEDAAGEYVGFESGLGLDLLAQFEANISTIEDQIDVVQEEIKNLETILKPSV